MRTKSIFYVMSKGRKGSTHLSKTFVFLGLISAIMFFLLSSPLVTSLMFCTGRTIIEGSPTSCLGEENLFKDFIKNIASAATTGNIPDATTSKIFSEVTKDTKAIFTGNFFHTIFNILWFVLVMNYSLFTNILLSRSEVMEQINEKPVSYLRRLHGKWIDLTVTVLIATALILAFVDSISKYDQTKNILELFILFDVKLFLLVPLLMVPLFPLFMMRKLFIIDEKSIIFDALNEPLSHIIDIEDKEESLVLEFKASFQTSYPKKPEQIKDANGQTYFSIGGNQRFKSEKEITKLLQDMVLEAIVGFLNSAGGQLIIGVAEKDNNKKYVGIEYENFASQDVYERHVIQLIINRIGIQFMGDYITTSFLEKDNKSFFVIEIKPFLPKLGQIPALLDGETCFKRTGPRTDKISSGTDFAQFVAQRISK